MSCKCDTINIINEEHKIIVAEDTKEEEKVEA